MHRSRLGTIVIDCEAGDLDAAADFWAQALGSKAMPLADANDAEYRRLETSPDQPTVLVQRVRHASRAHVDIETDDIEAEVRRLEQIGAKRIAQVRRWWVMEAPTGHRFCVVRPQRGDFPRGAATWA